MSWLHRGETDRWRRMDGGRKGTCRLGVLSIIEEEFDAVHRILGPLDQIRGTPFWTPDLQRLDVVATRSATRSNVPATQATMRLVENFRPEVVIVVGIGAAVVRADGKSAALLGDVVVPDYLHYAEYGKIAKGRHLARYGAYDQPSAGLLISEVEGAYRDGAWTGRIDVDPPEDVSVEEDRVWPRAVVGGSLVACEKVLSDPKDPYQNIIIQGHEDAIAVDMESYGVASALHEARSSVNYNPRLLVMRGVSDYVREGQEKQGEADNQEMRDKWKKYACASAVCFASDVVRRILDLDDERAESREGERQKRGEGG